MTDPLLPGDPTRLGSLRLLGRLGAGGMGQVYLGRTTGGRLVAVKTVHPHLAADPHFRERFRREAAAARAVTGAHTAAVLDADPDSPVPWLATAYLSGVTLRRAVAATGPLPDDAVRALGAALAEALTGIHGAGLVHRDLKPSNVLVTADGPRIIGFGIAWALSDHGLTAAGDIVGTPGFIAPEQITDASPVTGAADVFALGAVLAFAATGRNPFGDGTAAILLYRAVHEAAELPDVPDPLRTVIATCLRKEPELRPTVAAVLLGLADPAAPLWWRAEPLRTLMTATDGTAPKASEDSTVARPTTTLTLVTPSVAAGRRRFARGRVLARRGVLLAGAGGLATLIGLAARDRDGGTAGADALTATTAGSAAPGALRWTLVLKDGVVDGMVLDRNSALVLHATTGPGSGNLQCFRPEDGAPRWHRRAGAGTPGAWGVHAGVLVAGEVGAHAIRPSTGEPVGDPATLPPAPLWYTVAGPTLITEYPADADLPLYGFDLRTGAVRWRLSTQTLKAPAVVDGAVLLAPESTPGVVCVDTATGEELWRAPDLNDGDRIVAMAGLSAVHRFAVLTESGTLHLFGARDGSRVARQRPMTAVRTGTAAVADDGGVGLLIAGGTLCGFTTRDGRRRWQRATFGLEANWPVTVGGARRPVLPGGRVLLHWSAPGTLEALDTRTGAVRWRRALPGIAQLPPVLGGPVGYAATNEVCAQLDLATGTPLRIWREPGLQGIAADGWGWYARTADRVRAYNRVLPVSGGPAAAATAR
ncbi:PQQ-binding-like beta-propeller repeat protein [Streptomyces sp. NPDC020965]|uniref:protein kinase domain-containing protein n=1 Tax=Streptomyces sp. NPDC020965 TaxID=3365105 RepID=UPI0037B42F8B